jgi:molybdopterin synthase sulfur carrier subunit
MATIKIKLFAHLREQVGEAEFSVQLDMPTTVKQVLTTLAADSEAFEAYYSSSPVLVAVNQTMVDHDFPVNEADEIALFPPVTGG